ncbi:MAG: fumarylacetoacetase [Cyclobacteriaceae bacterium]|jgi:fumarylacetoacetase|nr:fumarylacetoacetase [Cyclobacteriaceae bacterium]
MVHANDPSLKSWVQVSPGSDFPIQNLPFGIFKTRYLSPVAGVAIGDYVLDLVYLHENGYLDGLGLPPGIFNQPYLNNFLRLGRNATTRVRGRISELLRQDNDELQGNPAAREIALVPMLEVRLMMPLQVPNYTDFYSSEEHATNVGSMFRDPQNALLPNWKHLPVGYHGRASSIVVSGTNIHRPKGQMKLPDAANPVFGPSRKMDFELEMAFVTCAETPLGHSITTAEAEDHIFGFVLFNDWSARDIQQWEYVPLGPFLGKNFGSTVSPWIVTLDALEPFRCDGPQQQPEVLPYLRFNGKKNFDIHLEVVLQTSAGEEVTLCRSNTKYLYWNISQQLAHHTVNGCSIQTGDLYASGTISGPSPGSFGSMLELTWNGARPLVLPDGTERKFLEDNDTVIIKAYAENNGIRIGFGECRSTLLPALP